MNTDDLVKMANQIADYFRAYPEDEAVEGVAEHIRQFWDPRMRDGLRARLQSQGLFSQSLMVELVEIPDAEPAALGIFDT